MAFLSMEDWQLQSSLLLKARPSTTRITTSYSRALSSRARKRRTESVMASKPEDRAAQQAAIPSTVNARSATLTLKTYDPVSGVCLKYRTHKAAEAGRLITSLGNLGRWMAAVPGTDAITQGTTTLVAGEDLAIEDRNEVAGAGSMLGEAGKTDDTARGVESKGVGTDSGGGTGKKRKKPKK